MQKERPNARRGGGNSYIEQSQAAEEKRQTLQAFLINLFLTVVLPPVGVLLAWRSKRLNAALRGRGGGRGALSQGSVPADRAEIEAYFADFTKG